MIVIPETAVGRINGLAVALSGIYAEEGKLLVDVYIQGVPTVRQAIGDRLDFNGEQWFISGIERKPENAPQRKGQVTFAPA